MFRRQSRDQELIEAENSKLKCFRSLISTTKYQPLPLSSLSQLSHWLSVKNRILKKKTFHKAHSGQDTRRTHKYDQRKLDHSMVWEEMKTILLDLELRQIRVKQPYKEKSQSTDQFVDGQITKSKAVQEQNIWQCLQTVGNRDMKQLANKLSLSNLSEEETYTAVSCLIRLQSQDQISHYLGNLSIDNYASDFTSKSNYSKLIESLNQKIKARSCSEELFQIFTSQSLEIPQLKSNHFFSETVRHIKSLIIVSKDTITFSQAPSLDAYIDQKFQKQAQKYAGQLRGDCLWQKIAFLMRKSPKYHSLIDIHLRSFAPSVGEYFNTILQGKIGQFQKDVCLYNSNPYYRQFLHILERKYIEQVSTLGKASYNDQNIEVCVKEIYLNRLFNESNQTQVRFIQKFSSQKMHLLEEWLATGQQQRPIKMLEQLILLGNTAQLIATLQINAFLSPVEALLLHSPLLLVDTRPSFLLYQPKKTVQVYQNIIKKCILNTTEKQSSHCSELLRAFLPLLRPHLQQPEQFMTTILAQQLPLLNYIASSFNFWDYCLPLGLQPQHLPLLIQKLLINHSCFVYCSELAISICVPLSQIYKQTNYSHDNRSHRSQRKRKISQSISPATQVLRSYSSLKIQGPSLFKMQLLLQLITIFSTQGCHMLKDAKKRQKDHQKMVNASKLLLKFKRKEMQDMLSDYLGPKDEETKVQLNRLPQILMLLEFSQMLVSLKVALTHSQYQDIVNCLNIFIEDLYNRFDVLEQTVMSVFGPQDGSQTLNTMFDLLLQSLIVMGRYKSRVIDQNRVLLRCLCRQLQELFQREGSKNKDYRQRLEKWLLKFQLESRLTHVSAS